MEDVTLSLKSGQTNKKDAVDYSKFSPMKIVEGGDSRENSPHHGGVTVPSSPYVNNPRTRMENT